MSANGWQPIEGWDGRYQVSLTGEVRRSDDLILKQWTNSHGYMLVRLSCPRKVERVHRLVAAAFIPNLTNRPFVNHINNDRADNRAENLEWCTQWENLSHARKQGRMQQDYWSGKRSPNAALTEEQVLELRASYKAGRVSFAELGRRYGISKRAVGRCIARETYSDVC